MSDAQLAMVTSAQVEARTHIILAKHEKSSKSSLKLSNADSVVKLSRQTKRQEHSRMCETKESEKQ